MVSFLIYIPFYWIFKIYFFLSSDIFLKFGVFYTLLLYWAGSGGVGFSGALISILSTVLLEDLSKDGGPVYATPGNGVFSLTKVASTASFITTSCIWLTESTLSVWESVTEEFFFSVAWTTGVSATGSGVEVSAAAGNDLT